MLQKEANGRLACLFQQTGKLCSTKSANQVGGGTAVTRQPSHVSQFLAQTHCTQAIDSLGTQLICRHTTGDGRVEGRHTENG